MKLPRYKAQARKARFARAMRCQARAAERAGRWWIQGHTRTGRRNHIRSHGLAPVRGQPGLFRDRDRRRFVNIRDFKETPKYDTITIGPRPTHEADFCFVQLRSKDY